MASGIIITNLVKTYRRGKVKALNGVHVSFESGKTHGLIGPNGSGKTTLLGCLLGLLHRDAGTIEIDGMSPNDFQFKASLGYVPERLRFDMWMKAWDFMIYHCRLLNIPSTEHKKIVVECLERVGLENKHWNERLKTFSRGMLQRLGLAQALLGKPKYLFLDEPTSGMDPAGVILFRKVVKEESSKGCLVLLSSHQLNQVEQLCDKVHFINKGIFENIENNPAQQQTRNILIKWSNNGQPIQKIPTVQGVRLLEQKEREALFCVPGDQEAQKIIATMIESGFPVIEAIPDTSRLERLFATTEGGFIDK